MVVGLYEPFLCAKTNKLMLAEWVEIAFFFAQYDVSN